MWRCFVNLCEIQGIWVLSWGHLKSGEGNGQDQEKHQVSVKEPKQQMNFRGIEFSWKNVMNWLWEQAGFTAAKVVPYELSPV